MSLLSDAQSRAWCSLGEHGLLPRFRRKPVSHSSVGSVGKRDCFKQFSEFMGLVRILEFNQQCPMTDAQKSRLWLEEFCGR